MASKINLVGSPFLLCSVGCAVVGSPCSAVVGGGGVPVLTGGAPHHPQRTTGSSRHIHGLTGSKEVEVKRVVAVAYTCLDTIETIRDLPKKKRKK